MAISKMAAAASFQIEIESGTDSSGNTVYKKRTFNNVKTNADLENIYAVADAIKGVLDVNTRNIILSESSKLVSKN